MYIKAERFIITELTMDMCSDIASHKVLEKNGFKLVFKGIDKYQGKNRELRKYIFER